MIESLVSETNAAGGNKEIWDTKQEQMVLQSLATNRLASSMADKQVTTKRQVITTIYLPIGVKLYHFVEIKNYFKLYNFISGTLVVQVP